MDDTTRGVGGDDMTGRSEETTRNYAGEPARPETRRQESTRSTETVRSTAEPTGSAEGPELDPESDRRTREIQGEIAHTRAEMSETIGAIQDRLRPGNLVSDAKDKVKAVTTEKVKSMADTATGTAQGMMRETRERAQDFVQGARQNPIPALMIGAGVAWLLMDRARKTGNGHAEHAEWSEYSTPRYAGYQGTDDYTDPYYSGTDDTRAMGRYGRRSEGFGSRAREAAEEARRTARRTQSGLQRMLHQNPLLVGAAAVLVGAAVGASLPETQREKELMGETRDNVVDRAQEVARDAAGTVREVAGETVGDAVGKVAKRVTSGETK